MCANLALSDIPLPDLESRTELVKINLNGIKTTEDVSAEWVAGALDGYSGADITNVRLAYTIFSSLRCWAVLRSVFVKCLIAMWFGSGFCILDAVLGVDLPRRGHDVHAEK